MKNKLFLILLFTLILIWSSCSDYATGVDPLIDKVEDELLTSEAQTEFVINGVKTRFASVQDELMLSAGLLSDELFFDPNLPGASWPQFNEFDRGDIRTDNASATNYFLDIGELRFFADDLVRRVNEINYTDEELKNRALYEGNLYGGIARYMYATYWGLSQEQGGGVIDEGPFIPSDQMYAQAIEKFQSALENTSDAYQQKLLNSLIARTYLFLDDFSNALTFAQNGLVEGDEPFQGLHNVEASNYWWIHAGRGRTQGGADYRFNNYITEDPNEANRVIIEEVMGLDGSTLYYRQAKYIEEGAPLTFISWQENELMLAELNLRNADATNALARVNAVRASHGIDALTTVDMRTLITERDKELCFTGARLPDQRRFANEYNTWHLDVGSWKYLPIPDRERNVNPNIGG